MTKQQKTAFQIVIMLGAIAFLYFGVPALREYIPSLIFQ